MKHYIKWTSFVLIAVLQVSPKALASSIKTDSTIIPPMYGECTHPGKYEPIGILTSCCTGKGDWTITYEYMRMEQNGLMNGHRAVTDGDVFAQYANVMSPHSMLMQCHMLMGMYGISNRFSLTALLTYNQNNMRMTAMSSDMMINEMDMGKMSMPTQVYSSSIGDSKLYLMYKLIKECGYNVILSGGVNLPTGSTQLTGSTVFGDGLRLPYAMQGGEGTWNILPGITWFGQKTIRHHYLIAYGVEALADIKPALNREGYAYGNNYSITSWLAYKCDNHLSFSVRVKGMENNKMSGFDPSIYPMMYNDPMANTANFGGEQWMAYGGVNYYLNKSFLKDMRFLAEYGLPLYQKVNGFQTGINKALHVGCKYSF